jgi:hypothetical protein
MESNIAMETPYILKTNISKEDAKRLKPIIMKKYLQEPLSMRQRSNLVALYEKYSEMKVEGVIFHGMRAMGKKQYIPCPREENDSFYEDSEETIDIEPPAGPTPVTIFLQSHTQSTVGETLEQIQLPRKATTKPSEPISTQLSSFARVYEMSEEKIFKPLKAQYWEQYIVAFNSDREESSEEVEKHLVEVKPYQPSLGDLLTRAKASQSADEERLLGKRSKLADDLFTAQERKFLEYVLERRVANREVDWNDIDKFYKIKCRYGISYITGIFEHEVRIEEGEKDSDTCLLYGPSRRSGHHNSSRRDGVVHAIGHQRLLKEILR